MRESDILLNLSARSGRSAVIRMAWTRGNTSVPEGRNELAAKSNFLLRSNSQRWVNVPTYGSLHYREIYPGVDLEFHGNGRALEYDLLLAPGADPSVIDLKFEGALQLRLDGTDVVIETEAGQLRQTLPSVFQETSGQRRKVSAGYVIHGENQIRFAIGPYDPSEALTIDPVLSYSTLLGGSQGDYGYAMALDSGGNIYLTGYTQSTDFPTTVGVYDATKNFYDTGFVVKLNPAGTAIIYSTYLGDTVPSAIAVDGPGNTYIAGNPGTGFVTTPGAYRSECIGSAGPVFVLKLNASGIRAIVHHRLTEVLGAMLDSDRPGVEIVDQPVPAREFGRFVQPCVALMFNQVRPAGNGLLDQLHHAGFGLVNISRGVLRVQVGPEV